ncbi:V-type ATP synthase subunit E [Clostridium intestinale]|uniref:V-type proton ATPase subunit E n=1 Tax=Clostridium intestinale DSM 6191 TaxID=1121320 RepID=A0A1M5Y1B3_9CLOT|nr:V-type ATP synthase subunit E [Clostridium intestinale]SHI05792.1 V/A-type H+-transporting ATPase subunit E [Clostridium intestinale DSM 6191]
MSNIKNLTEKILEEAKHKEKEIAAYTESEKEKILSSKIKEAEDERKLILLKAEEEAKTKKERIISSTTLKVRNEKLEIKQKLISEVFDKALEELCSMNSSKLKNFIKHTILDLDIEGDETIIFNEDGKSKIDDKFIEDLNFIFLARNKKGELKVREENGNFKGGFIVEKNGVEINNTFESLMDSMKDELEYEVSKALFN